MTDSAIKTAIRKTLAKYIELAKTSLGVALSMPQIDLSLRGSDAGQAHRDKNTIRINKELFLLFPDYFHQNTIPHELAHRISFVKYGQACKAHGREWKEIMIALGVPVKRLHNLPVPRKQGKVYPYICGCPKERFITQTTHKMIEAGEIFRCTTCQVKLIYKRTNIRSGLAQVF